MKPGGTGPSAPTPAGAGEGVLDEGGVLLDWTWGAAWTVDTCGAPPEGERVLRVSRGTPAVGSFIKTVVRMLPDPITIDLSLISTTSQPSIDSPMPYGREFRFRVCPVANKATGPSPRDIVPNRMGRGPAVAARFGRRNRHIVPVKAEEVLCPDPGPIGSGFLIPDLRDEGRWKQIALGLDRGRVVRDRKGNPPGIEPNRGAANGDQQDPIDDDKLLLHRLALIGVLPGGRPGRCGQNGSKRHVHAKVLGHFAQRNNTVCTLQRRYLDRSDG